MNGTMIAVGAVAFYLFYQYSKNASIYPKTSVTAAQRAAAAQQATATGMLGTFLGGLFRGLANPTQQPKPQSAGGGKGSGGGSSSGGAPIGSTSGKSVQPPQQLSDWEANLQASGLSAEEASAAVNAAYNGGDVAAMASAANVSVPEMVNAITGADQYGAPASADTTISTIDETIGGQQPIGTAPDSSGDTLATVDPYSVEAGNTAIDTGYGTADIAALYDPNLVDTSSYYDPSYDYSSADFSEGL